MRRQENRLVIRVTRAVKVTQSEEQKGKRTKQKQEKGPMRGPASAVGEMSSRGQADQPPESAPTPSICPPCCQGAPGGRSAPHQGGDGGAREETWEAVN